MYIKDLSANVPLYGQEQCNYCGAASGQMIRHGYPNPGDRLFYTQLNIWNTIQVDNSMDPADVATAWATDPQGLRACLQSLNNPAGVHWAEFVEASRDAVIFDMLYWMNIREFPSAVLINQGGHWVVIVGFVTDVEPVSGSAPTLQTISIHDPEPHNVGTDTLMTGAQWFAGPWNGAVVYAGTWHNKYVAIVEPPFEKGEVKVKKVTRTGRKLLPPAEALKHAKRIIDEMNLAEQSKYKLLGHKDVVNLEPILVREEIPGSQEKNVAYYIVQFGFKNEFGERKSRMARVCVLVNAYTGQLEEVTTFGKPVRYLPKEEILEIVATAMNMEQEELKDVDATLMFQPSDITHVRAWPFWRVKIGSRTVYVDQLGKLYGKLLPSIPGD